RDVFTRYQTDPGRPECLPSGSGLVVPSAHGGGVVHGGTDRPALSRRAALSGAGSREDRHPRLRLTRTSIGVHLPDAESCRGVGGGTKRMRKLGVLVAITMLIAACGGSTPAASPTAAAST